MAKILDGKWLSNHFQKSIFEEVQRRSKAYGRPPGLGVILVGDNPASKVYVGNKERVAKQRCGFATFDTLLPENASEEQVRSAILAFNEDSSVDGILLQLPLPKHLPTNKLLDSILPSKDADGLHPLNQGLLLRGEGLFRPCTPQGVMALVDLAYSSAIGNEVEFDPLSMAKADLAGKTAVVIGRSILVGKPVGAMLLERNATVIQAHSKTRNLESVCANADLIIAAVGVPGLVKSGWVNPGSIVIDVGINRLDSGKLVGDVDYPSVVDTVQAITPVPGGVGPMTITMLMYNTLESYRARFL